MSSVSFQGNITVTTWNKTISSFKSYPTTAAQDKLIKDIAKDMGEKGVVHPVNKRQAHFLYQLIEKFTGREIPKVNTEKVFYNNGDQIIFADKNPALFDGARIEVDF
jgi:hypothetical protein